MNEAELKKKLTELAHGYGASKIKFVTDRGEEQIWRPDFEGRKVGLPMFFVVKGEDIEVIEGLDGLKFSRTLNDVANDSRFTYGSITFDSAISQRRIDENGFLHVEKCHITKEQVVPYYGREIPGWRDLNLDPEKIYHVYRPGDELAKAYQTFNGLPLQLEHHPDSAEHPQTMHRVGSLGTDAEWNPPYVDITLSVTDQRAIDAIQDGRFKELSASYQYDPEVTRGEFNGEPYEIVMRNIRGNHVALVKEGRAGPDVVVADAKPIMKRKSAYAQFREWFNPRAELVHEITPFSWQVAKDSVTDSRDFAIWFDKMPTILDETVDKSIKRWYYNNGLVSDWSENPEGWITVKGTHIPVEEGQTRQEAARNFIQNKQAESAANKGQKQSAPKLLGSKPKEKAKTSKPNTPKAEEKKKNPDTVSGKDVGSPSDAYMQGKSWDQVKSYVSNANDKMKFGEDSEGNRTMKEYPHLQKTYDQAASHGPGIAKDYEEIAKSLGGIMYGKEFGIKSASSLERKIRDKVAEAKELGKDLDPQKVIDGMTDIVRFTTLADRDEIPNVGTKMIDEMQKRGYELVEVSNKWDDPYPYCGLHMLFSKDGVTFESQIHSPDGMIIKNKLHPLYEISRDKKKTQAERDEANRKQAEIAKDYIRPKGIEIFKDWSKGKDGGEYRVGR